MFAFIARRQYLRGPADLEHGAFDDLLRQFEPSCEFTFVGRSPLGARLRSREALRRWFARLDILLPRPHFEVRELLVTGWPWALHLAARVVIRSTVAGEPHENEFAQILRIHWGRVVWDYVLEDTQRFEGAVARLVATGMAEATADLIRDIPRLEGTDEHAA